MTDIIKDGIDLTFDEFAIKVRNNILDYLPERFSGSKVEILKTCRLNESYQGLKVVLQAENAGPIINLDDLYGAYEAGCPFSTLMDAVAENIDNSPGVCDISKFKDYEWVRERLYIRICGTEFNREILKNVPHREVMDLSVTCSFFSLWPDSDEQTVLITNDLFASYGISEDELFRDAYDNSLKIRPAGVCAMGCAVSSGLMMGGEMNKDLYSGSVESVDFKHDSMYILSTKTGIFGASAMLYPGLLKTIADSNELDFFIIPSSVDEVIIFADHGMMSANELEDIIRSVNRSVVDPKCWLSNTPYRYCHKSDTLEPAANYAQKMHKRA